MSFIFIERKYYEDIIIVKAEERNIDAFHYSLLKHEPPLDYATDYDGI